jgi:hypothetical protein|tara:strand:+ start:116 stop:952 length:837 start_codon:yes stop_codon:yes gene_type:complete
MDFNSVFANAVDNSVTDKPKHGFQIRRPTKRARVTDHPDIYTMSGTFDVEDSTLVSQTHFFNRANTDADYTHVSPWDFPFVQELMERTPIRAFDINKMSGLDAMRADLEPVTRAYEEAFMCEPTGDQRACVMADECEGNCIPDTGANRFTLREFLLPSQLKEYEATKRYPLKTQPCIFCKRKQIAQWLVSLRASGNGLQEDTVMQDYYNLVDIPGEYRLADTLLSKRNIYEGLISPVVLHVRNAYKFKRTTKRTYEQWKMPFLTEAPGAAPGITPSSN